MLNTLDLLKKGTSAHAQRARQASRILEAQVGTNPRIRVQQDDAFVLWDKIAFKDLPGTGPGEAENGKSVSQPNASPEWVRRTICCARWEVDNAANPSAPADVKDAPVSVSPISGNRVDKPGATPAKRKVVLAVLSSAPNLSPYSHPLKLGEGEAPLNPVPLPAPVAVNNANKHEPRSSGTFVAHWAARAGLELLEVDPTSPSTPNGTPGRTQDEDDRVKRPNSYHGSNNHATRGRRPSHTDNGGRVGLVERPPAVMAMMEMVAQPSKVVRVLARGEKLDPDP